MPSDKSQKSLHPTIQQWVEDHLGGPIRSVRTLAGATSSVVSEVATADRVAILRCFLTHRWGAEIQGLAQREAVALSIAKEAFAKEGFAQDSFAKDSSLASLVPGVIAWRELHQTVPASVLMQKLPGTVLLPATPTTTWLAQLAERLADVHSVSIDTLAHTDLSRASHEPQNRPVSGPLPALHSWNNANKYDPPDWLPLSLWHKALDATRDLPSGETVLLHRDYHPANVLWDSNGQISGLVDWVNACVGPAGQDVAHCRANLALMYGLPVADEFLGHYTSARAGYRHSPAWDIEDILSAFPNPQPYVPWAEFGLRGVTEQVLRRRIQAFLTAAIDRVWR